MKDDKSTSLVNLGKLSNSANKLIEKASEVVGGIFKPWQTIRVTKAEAEAALIKAETEVKVADIHRRAMHRWIEEEAQRQQNMENVTRKAIPHLAENSKPNKMDNDWIVNFFDKARIISDDEMQVRWARVLAGEANSPGAYSKRSVNFLSSMDKKDADLFENLCRFGIRLGKLYPLIFDSQASIYNEHGINYEALAHLDNIGLIRLSAEGTDIRTGPFPKRFLIIFNTHPLQFVMEEGGDDRLPTGIVSLSQIGQELASLCNIEPVEGFVDYVKERWKQHLPTEIPSKN